jgi:hypothetical protein
MFDIEKRKMSVFSFSFFSFFSFFFQFCDIAKVANHPEANLAKFGNHQNI